ncbi:MAG TPA: oxaloacetate decarboxylase [Gaiellaceae bacterium]|nr:oxaloacetate decarboxylase [Gaiellaceae bacterium]
MTESTVTSEHAATPAATRLRRLLDEPGTMIVPGAYSAFVARIFEESGFDAVYVGGHGAAAIHGFPDVGLITQTEMAAHIERIATSISIPVIADADEGYGDIINVVRTIQLFERAGAAGIQLEDQQAPKRCGHMEGKRLIPRDAMLRKIEAAASARTCADTVLIARTDAIAVEGLDDAIARLDAYAREGADVLFLEAPRSVEELKAAVSVLDKPLLANISEGGKTPIVELAELQELGIKIALYPSSAIFAAAHAARQVASTLRETGSTSPLVDRMMPLDEFNDLAGFPHWREIEGRFAARGEA